MAAKWNENKNKNKHYNAYLVHQNYHQIWENNRMPTDKQKERRIIGNKEQIVKEK